MLGLVWFHQKKKMVKYVVKKGKIEETTARINPFGEEKNLFFFVIRFNRLKDQFAVVASTSCLHICLKSSCMFQTSSPFTTGSTIWNSLLGFLGVLIVFSGDSLGFALHSRDFWGFSWSVFPAFFPPRHHKFGVLPDRRATDKNSKRFIKLSENQYSVITLQYANLFSVQWRQNRFLVTIRLT